MKKAILYILAVVTITASSCEKLINKLPTDAQPGDEVLKSAGNVLAVLASSYNRFADGNFLGGEIQRTAELYGDQLDLSNATGGAPAQFVSRQFNTFNQQGRDIWITGYEAIARANTVLGAIESAAFSDTSAAAKASWKGEALFIRGVAHFELVRIYAKPYTSSPATNPGVVLRLKALTASETQVEAQRSTVQQTYDAVIADLKQAESLLPATNGVRATKWAAKAYLARIYFSMADYANAYTYANDVIENGGFSLGDDVTSVFKTNGNITQVPAGAVYMVLGDAGRLRGNFWNSNLDNTFLPLGSNIAQTISTKGGTRKTSLTAIAPNDKSVSLKWSQLQDGAVNVPIIRLAEMYLIRAESSVLKGGFADADVRADYNAVRAVAGVDADETTTGAEALLTAIRTEREVEFFTEGMSYHELRRLKAQVRGIAYDDAKGLLKIPDGEVRVNPSMIQN